MAFVLTFSKYRPSPRSDGLFWTQAVIEQASIPDLVTMEPGAFAPIETKLIAPYGDPAVPPTLSFTTELATALPGWYRITFKDATGDQELTLPRLFSGATFRPSTRDVAAFIKNRTVDRNNNFLGDFNNLGVAAGGTAVSADEVESLIQKAESRVLRRIDKDPNIPLATESQAAVTDAIALYAAILVEVTKYSEQIARQTSPYPQLKELFDDTLSELREDILGVTAGTSGTGGRISQWNLVAGQSMAVGNSMPEGDQEKVTYKTGF